MTRAGKVVPWVQGLQHLGILRSLYRIKLLSLLLMMGLHQIFTRRGILLYSIVVASHIECRGLNHRHVSILKWTDMLLSVVLLLLSSHIIAQRHAPISHLSVSLLIKLSLKQLSFLLLGFLHLVSVTLNQASTELHDTGFEITLYFLERDSRTE